MRPELDTIPQIREAIWAIETKLDDRRWFKLMSGNMTNHALLANLNWTAANHVIDANVDMNGFNLVLDADGDTSISAPVDDQIDIEIGGADDFTFTANSFNVLAGSNITMADDSWIGLGAAAGRMEFDDQAIDEINFLDCYVGIGHQAPLTTLHLEQAIGTELRIGTTGLSDPTLSFVATNTPTQVNWYLDESNANDMMVMAGQTAGLNTYLDLMALNGLAMFLRFFSGANYSQIVKTAGDEFLFENNTADADIIFQILDGAVVNEMIRIDAGNSRVGVSRTVGDIVPDVLFHVEDSDDCEDVIIYPFRVTHALDAGSTAAAGFGVGHQYELEDAAGGMDVAGTMECFWIDPDSGSEDAAFTWGLMVGGAAVAEQMRLVGNTLTFTATGNIGLTGIDADLIQLTAANTVLVNGTVQATRLGVNTAPSANPRIYVNIRDATINSTFGIYNIWCDTTKTAGNSNRSDSYVGIYSSNYLNQPVGVGADGKGEIGFLWGIYGEARLGEGNVGNAANPRTAAGLLFVLNLDNGIVWSNAFGDNVTLDQEGANEVKGNIYARYTSCDADGTTGGLVYMHYLNELSNIDYCIYQASTGTPAPSYLPGGFIQPAAAGAIPVTVLDQDDVDEPFIKFIGTAAAADLTRSIVDNDDVGETTLVGWVKIEIEDLGNQIPDSDYYVPAYTLTPPA